MPSKAEIQREIQAMKKLGLTDSEIQDVLESDKLIEKGEKLFELTEEGKKASQKAKSTGKTVYNFNKPREKKINNDKLKLIEILQKALADNGCELTLTINPEREFEFIYANKKYKVVMSMPRK